MTASQQPLTVQSTDASLRHLQDGVRKVLDASLREKIVSHSPHQMTGNAYQAVRLGEVAREGFRKSRPNLLAGFALDDRTVCDLGANLGEISRDLKRAGAALVDAYEYDRLFTQQARYITAYNGMHDINHFEADVSAPGFMRRAYDVCVGLSAFSYMGKNIDYICGQVRQTMIVETHEVRDPSWVPTYVLPIAQHLPHWCVFGIVSHGDKRTPKRRLWLAFSKANLAPFYTARSAALAPGEEGVVEFDIGRSKLPYLDHVRFEPGDVLAEPRLKEYRERLRAFEEEIGRGAYVNVSMSGVAYWLSLLSGVVEFERDQALLPSNVYMRWLRRGLASGVVDPGLRHLLDDEEKLLRRIGLRMAAMARALRERRIEAFAGMPIAYNATPDHPALHGLHFKALTVAETGEPLCVPMVDGHHRLFAMRLLDVSRCPMMMIWDPSRLGAIDSVARVRNYEQRMRQYIAGTSVDDPVLAP